jgi:Tol biopolymer transport system component
MVLKRLLSFVSALVISTTSLFVLYAPTVHAANNGELVFSRSTDGGSTFNLYTDGGGITQLTSGGQDVKPCWSPDGTKVAFVRQVALNGFGNIYVIDADGSNLTQLTNSAPTLDDSDPVWSPDGTKIAFTSNRSGGAYQIYTMNADGSNQTNISNQTAGHDSRPSWSPDGTKIVFESKRTGQSNLFTMNADGTSPGSITSNGSVAIFHHPVYSIDGTKILYSMNGGGSTDYGLNEMNANGVGSISSLGSDAGRSYTFANYSPDGNSILFTSRVGTTIQLMYVRSSDGGGLVNYSSNAYIDKQASWAPAPVASIDIAGATTANTQQPVTLTATAANCTATANGWTWSIAGGSGSSTTDSISVTWSGTGAKNVTVTNSGCGSVGTHTVTVAAGIGAAACISAANVTIGSGATYDVDLGGTAECTEHDQISATGTVTLGGTLAVHQLDNYVPAEGDSLIIIDNDGTDSVSGTFVGLDEGDTVTVAGVDMIISYNDGDGSNDVSLTVPLSTPTITVSGPATGFTGESRTFTASTSVCTPSANGWTWTTSGGTGTSTTNSINVTWSTTGSKTVHATNSGCAGAVVTDDTITISNAPTITVDGPTSGNINEAVEGFTATAANCTPSANGWTWSINGGTGTSTSDTIDITWATTGVKTISATNSACAGATVTTHQVTISDPDAQPTSTTDGNGNITSTVDEGENLSATTYTVQNKETLTNNGQLGDTTVSSGGTVKGNGDFGNLTIQSGGHLAPGNSPGCVTSTSLNLASGSSYDYDQAKVDGAVDVTGANLNVQLISDFKPKKDDSFRIIDNDASEAVTGTFAGLAEGATFTVSGYVFKISYVGGTGNDVVLTVQSVPTTPNTGLSLLFANPLVALITTTVLASGLYAMGNKRRLMHQLTFGKK